MRVAVIDADLIGRKKHRFPNLAIMKLSGYHKKKGDDVTLELSYDNLENYDKVYISKVFTDTPIPEEITKLSWVECGGTGFYFDKAPKDDKKEFMVWVEANVPSRIKAYVREKYYGKEYNLIKSKSGRYMKLCEMETKDNE